MAELKWTLVGAVKIVGHDSIGNGYDIDEEIRVPLSSTNQAGAMKEIKKFVAMAQNATKVFSREFFRQYCGAISAEDGLTFSKFRLICEGEKELNIQIPRLVGGP